RSIHCRSACVPVSSRLVNAPPTTDIYTLSLHDALPISYRSNTRMSSMVSLQTSCGPDSDSSRVNESWPCTWSPATVIVQRISPLDRKSTRLNSSHVKISYAVFCLKKKNTNKSTYHT